MNNTFELLKVMNDFISATTPVVTTQYGPTGAQKDHYQILVVPSESVVLELMAQLPGLSSPSRDLFLTDVIYHRESHGDSIVLAPSQKVEAWVSRRQLADRRRHLRFSAKDALLMLEVLGPEHAPLLPGQSGIPENQGLGGLESPPRLGLSESLGGGLFQPPHWGSLHPPGSPPPPLPPAMYGVAAKAYLELPREDRSDPNRAPQLWAILLNHFSKTPPLVSEGSVTPATPFPEGEPFQFTRTDRDRPVRIPDGHTLRFVSDRAIHVLSAVRAILLVLLDASDEVSLDLDYVGYLPSQDVLSAVQILLKVPLPDFVSCVKYWKDTPLATFLRNPLPPVPTAWLGLGLSPSSPLFTGDLARLWRRLCHCPPSTQRSRSGLPLDEVVFRVVFGIAQAKKACAPVPESFEVAALLKHHATLTRAPSVLEDTRPLRRWVRFLFRNFHPHGLVDGLTTVELSNKASTTFRRYQGGVRSDIRTLLSSHSGLPVESSTFLRMVETKRGVETEYGLPALTKEEWHHEVSVPPYNSGDPEEKLKALSNPPLNQYGHFSVPICRVEAVTEPLKVRCITAMNGRSTFFCKTLQKALFHHLRKFPMFSLIGETLSEPMLDRLLSDSESFWLQCRSDPLSNSEEFKGYTPSLLTSILSGDYQAATDNIHIQCTLLCIEEIVRCLSPADRKLSPHIYFIMVPQLLKYPSPGAYVGSPMPPDSMQLTGQLMGSVLSFIVLCVLNSYTYFNGLPTSAQNLVYSGRLSVKSLPVKINGDDILFFTSPALTERWLLTANSLGLQLSQGKNFIHPKFGTVNSTPLVLRPGYVVPPVYQPRVTDAWADLEDLHELRPEYFSEVVVGPTFAILPSSNCGLLVGMTKLGRNDWASYPLSAWHSLAVLGSLNPPQSHRFFLNYHIKEILSQTRFGKMTLNLFAHPMLGGLGFTVPRGLEVTYSPQQRMLAHRLLHAAHDEFIGQSSEHPLKAFTSLSMTSKVQPSLSSRRAMVRTRLGPLVGPLREYETAFEDLSAIDSVPLTIKRFDLSDELLRVSCRLNSAEINSLLSRTSHHRGKHLDPSLMSYFPYRVVEFNPPQVFELGETDVQIIQPSVLVSSPHSLPTLEQACLDDSSWEDFIPSEHLTANVPPPAIIDLPVVGPPVRNRSRSVALRRSEERAQHVRMTGPEY